MATNPTTNGKPFASPIEVIQSKAVQLLLTKLRNKETKGKVGVIYEVMETLFFLL